MFLPVDHFGYNDDVPMLLARCHIGVHFSTMLLHSSLSLLIPLFHVSIISGEKEKSV